METNFYNDDFEQLLKEKSDEFRMYPSKRVWHSIYNDLHPGRKWPSVAVSMILIIALLMLGYWNDNSAITITASTTQHIKPTGLIAAALHKTGATNTAIADYAMVPGDIKKLYQVNTAKTSTSRNNNEKNNVPYNSNDIFTGANSYLSFTGKKVATAPDNAGNAIIAKDQNIAFLQVGIDAIDKIIFNNREAETSMLAVNNENNVFTIEPLMGANKAFQQTARNKDLQSKNIAGLNKKDNNKTAVNNNEQDNSVAKNTVIADEGNTVATAATSNALVEDINTPAAGEAKDDKTVTANTSATNKNAVTETSDRAWMEDYAFHNKSKRKAWQDHTAIGVYLTPSIGYRDLSSPDKYNFNAGNAKNLVNQSAALNFEAGFTINYAVSKRLKINTGIQANYTNYSIKAEEINHPVITTLTLLDLNSGFAYMDPTSSTLANNSNGFKSTKVHNRSYQLSIPIGFAVKLAGKNKLEWYAGSTIQPTFVIGGKAYLISSDRKNYVEDASLMRKWNINSSFETYVNYKLNSYTLQLGPQFRYQLLSTYYQKYTVNEHLYNVGFKVGILKNF